MFLPGVAANPIGRNAELAKRVEQKRFYNALLDVLKEPPDRQPKYRKTKLLTVVAKLVNMAANGDLNATKMIIDRIDGPVPLPQYPGNGAPGGAASLTASGGGGLLVVRWGTAAPVPEPEAIPMLELHAVSRSRSMGTASEPDEKTSSIKHLDPDERG